jgi:hypothetical protein
MFLDWTWGLETKDAVITPSTPIVWRSQLLYSRAINGEAVRDIPGSHFSLILGGVSPRKL